MHRLSAALERVYAAAGVAAAGLICTICLVVTAQVALNIASRVGGPGAGLTIPSYADVAGYCLAAASFLSLAYTLRRDGHIRVTLVVDRLPATLRHALERVALLASAVLVGWMTWHLAGLVRDSIAFGDVSTGLLAIPLWVPQSAVAAGAGLLCVALVHRAVEPVPDGDAPKTVADGASEPGR